MNAKAMTEIVIAPVRAAHTVFVQLRLGRIVGTALLTILVCWGLPGMSVAASSASSPRAPHAGSMLELKPPPHQICAGANDGKISADLSGVQAPALVFDAVRERGDRAWDPVSGARSQCASTDVFSTAMGVPRDVAILRKT